MADSSYEAVINIDLEDKIAVWHYDLGKLHKMTVDAFERVIIERMHLMSWTT